MDDCAEAISQATGQTLKYVEVPRDAAAAAGYPGAADIANMRALASLVASSRLSAALPPPLSQRIGIVRTLEPHATLTRTTCVVRTQVQTFGTAGGMPAVTG